MTSPLTPEQIEKIRQCAETCLQAARAAYDKKDYHLALVWLSAAKDQIEHLEILAITQP